MTAKYFLNCRGVFQGGGCKAVAYIGAYRRALQCGIGFSEFAGTSAGSIIAALAAAGCTPEEMEQFLFGLDMKVFKTYESSGFIKKNYIRTNLLLMEIADWDFSGKIWGRGKMGALAIEKLGVQSSEYIETKIEETLQQKFPNVNATIRFSDLTFPLKIVAADIIEKRVKIWDNINTPYDSVAHAVRCSCSFPVFFRPVENRYIDGGILSNLPIIFFPDRDGGFERTIAFTLKHDSTESKNEFKRYAQSVVDTLTEGAVDLQMKERDKAVVIEVPTKVGLFDFDKINKQNADYKASIAMGEKAVDEFLRNEETRFKESCEYHGDSLKNAEQIYNQIIYMSVDSTKVTIVSQSLQWVWGLFLQLVNLVSRGIVVEVYTDNKNLKGVRKEVENSRIRLLNHLGIDVHVAQSRMFAHGFYFENHGTLSGIAIKSDGSSFAFGSLLTTPVDETIIKGLLSSLKNISFTVKAGLSKPSLQVTTLADTSNIKKCLSKCPHYAKSTYTIEKLKLKDLVFLTKYVQGYKYRQMEYLNSICPIAEEIPETIELSNAKLSNMCPILVDEINGKYYVIEGYARMLYLKRQGVSIAPCVVTHNSTRSFKVQAKQYCIDDLCITDKNFEIGTVVGMSGNQSQKKPSREIENGLRPPKTYLI